MKYIFDVDERNGKREIRLEITKNSGFGSNAYNIIECSDDNQNWTMNLESLFTSVINNMRLTVNERSEVRDNSQILIDYLKKNINSNDTHQMIVEENPGIPGILIQEQEI